MAGGTGAMHWQRFKGQCFISSWVSTAYYAIFNPLKTSPEYVLWLGSMGKCVLAKSNHLQWVKVHVLWEPIGNNVDMFLKCSFRIRI